MHEHLTVVSNSNTASSLNIYLVNKCSSGCEGNVRLFSPTTLFKAPLDFKCTSAFTMWLVLNFSLTSVFYLPFKHIIFAITKADYIIKCSIFWKTPSLEANASSRSSAFPKINTVLFSVC